MRHLRISETALAGKEERGSWELAPDLAYQRLGIVNVVFCGAKKAPDRKWVLVDAGVTGTAALIANAAKERFGSDSRPAAILLTHGHFDHVGALEELSKRWDAPIYAHPLEFPYLDGSASYPSPDPHVGGGMMASLSSLFPRGPINVGDRLIPLPRTLPEMPGWTWIHTPGHTPGHVSFWRQEDGALIAGDAFITTDQESAYAVVVQKLEIQGPPMYYTQNWEEAETSVKTLAALTPQLAVTGHGRAIKGGELRKGLLDLAGGFKEVAVPRHGRYVEDPTAAGTESPYERRK